MEFCAEFALLQGTLISAQRNFGSLNALTKDDASSIAAIVDSTKNVLHRIGEENLDEERKNYLRKVNLFLILNSDLSIRDSLMDDMNCGHVVGCTPIMSMHLLMELVWGLSLQKYFYETIMFSPPPLCVELLDAAAQAVKLLKPKEALQAVDELCRSTYIRALTLPNDQGASQTAIEQLLVRFKTLLNNFLDSNAECLMNLSKGELHMYAGQVMERLLNLLNFCLARYLVRAPGKDLQPVYNLVCTWDDSTHITKDFGEEITLENFNEVLLSICKCNLNHVTVDEWLEWVEFMADSDSTKTQQCVVAEKMYVCKESLQALKHSDELVKELTAMLASMAQKPRDEEDEIREADIETIVKNISSPTRPRGKWFKALIRLSDVLKNELSLCCLENNLDLVEFQDAESLLHLVVSHLEHDLDKVQCDRFKCLALNAVQNVDVDNQIKISENFVRKAGYESAVLLTQNFKDKITIALNKAIAAPQEVDKFLSDCTCLCLESARQVVEQLLAAGISNSSQGRMAVRVLGRLSVVCDLSCGDVGDTLLLQSILNLMAQHRDWSDTQRDNFTKFVAALAKRGILDSSVFMRKCLLPALHTSLLEKLWPSVLLWLQTVELFMETVQCDLNDACMLVIMAQVIEASQWNISTFSLEVVHAHEKAVHLLNMLVDILDLSNSAQVKWVQSKLMSLPARVWSYLSKVWDPWTSSGPRLCDLSMILLYLAHGRNDRAITTLQTSTYSYLEWILALVEVIPTMTASEWNLLAENLAKLNPGPLSVFYLVSDALLFVFVAVTNTKNKTVVSCVEYITRNFGGFVKNSVLPIISAEHGEPAVQVFEKCIQLLTMLPAASEESTMLQLSNVLADIISAAMLSGDTYTQQIAGSIDKLQDGEMKQALALKLHMGQEFSNCD